MTNGDIPCATRRAHVPPSCKMARRGGKANAGARVCALVVLLAACGAVAASALSSMTLAAMSTRPPAEFLLTPDGRIRHESCVGTVEDGATVVDNSEACEHKAQSYSACVAAVAPLQWRV